MDPRQLPVDDRFRGFCVYCGGPPESRDLVPSKVLLDDPLPPGLPIVEACSTCNSGFSIDEEYVACLLDCVIVGSTDLTQVPRKKVRDILARKPQLANRILSGRRQDSNGMLLWEFEPKRLEAVLVKLARGHTAFEFCLPQLDQPSSINMWPLSTMQDTDREWFKNAGVGEQRLLPEFGSRAVVPKNWTMC
jgi:hypothetical protein